MNSTDRLSTSIVDKNDRLMFQSQRLTQYRLVRYVDAYAYCMHECMRAIHSASLLYLYTGLRKPKERMKFD